MHPKSQILTILAATFFSVACSTTVESITSTPSSEDDRAPQGSAAESDSDELAFKAGPSALGHGRVAGAASYLRTTDAGAGGGTDAGTTATTVSTDKTSYTYGEVIKVTFANMPGNSDDWISFAPVGENNLYYSWWRYTKSSTGTTMETNALDKLPPGTYEARAYFANGYDIQATSAQFTVTGTMTTNPDASVSISGGQTTFTGLESIPVTYGGLEGQSWVGAYLTTGSMFSASGGWKYTPGGASGSVALDKLYGGTWEIRAFSNDSYELQAKSAGTITVTAAIETDAPIGNSVVVRFGGMAGFYNTDFVAIAPDGSADTAYDVNTRQYANLEAHGTRTISGLAAGTYVARAFNHGVAAAAAESAPFTITQ